MSNEELVLMIQQNGDSTLVLELLRRNKGFIYTCARPYLSCGAVEVDEVQSIGYLAIAAAIERWDPERQGGFLALFRFMLLGELGAAANGNRQAPVSEMQRGREARYREYCTDYERRHHGRQPTDAESEAALNLTHTQLMHVQQSLALSAPLRLDAPVMASDDDSAIMADCILDSTAQVEDTAVNEVYAKELRRELHSVLEDLPETQRRAIDNKLKGEDADGPTYRAAMQKLRKPAVVKRLRKYALTNYTSATGLTAFKTTGQSKTERVAIEFYGSQRRHHAADK